MKVIAAILVDLDESPLGTKSRLAEPLCGVPILRRTIERAMKCELPASLHVVCPGPQRDRVTELLSGLDVRIECHDAPPAPYQSLVRGGRFWGLDSWRGGAGAFCAFDEDFHSAVLDALARKMEAEAVAVIPAAAPLFDPGILDAMIRHARGAEEQTGVTFVQAPPGLGAFIIRRHILEQIAQSAIPPGAILAYQPATPMADLTGRDTCYRPSVDIIHARGRLLCDTRRSTERVRRFIESGAEREDAAAIGRRLIRESGERIDEMPEEIEIELTTDLPAGWTPVLRPMGGDTPRRGPISMAAIESIAASLHGHDDVRIVLGGFGEPMLHPEFADICRIFRAAGAMAVAVRTSGLVESDDFDRAIFETPVQLVETMLDAATAATYRRVHGIDAYEKASAILERRLERRVKENRVLPIWVPSLVKAEETFDDLEAFVDSWQRRLGMYAVTGYSQCAGQRPDHAVSRMAPPERTACRRVFSRMLVLADGSVTTCDQDYRGVQTVGRVPDSSLVDIWRTAAPLTSIRLNIVGDAPLCAKCDEWHRP